MDTFKKIAPKVSSVEDFMGTYKVNRERAEEMQRTVQRDKLFVNDTYSVTVSPPMDTFGQVWHPFIHLAIMRHDKQPAHSWSDLQVIKNELVGVEHEAIEIYPAESRLVDMAAQYHLWVFESPKVRIPTGWTSRMVWEEVHPGKERPQ